MPRSASLLGRTGQHRLRTRGETLEGRCPELEGRSTRGEALVDGLLGHAERGADLRPRVAAEARLVDEVAEQRIAGRLHACGDARRLAELIQRIITRGVGADGLDQFFQAGGGRHRWLLSGTVGDVVNSRLTIREKSTNG